MAIAKESLNLDPGLGRLASAPAGSSVPRAPAAGAVAGVDSPDTGRKRLWVFGVAMVVAVIALVTMLAIDARRSAAQARYIDLASYMLMGSQRLAKDAREAVRGTPQAFRSLSDSRATFDSVLDALDNGDAVANVDPSPAVVRPALETVQELWQPIRGQVGTILAQENVLLEMRQQVNAVNNLSPLLLAQSDQVVEAIAQSGGDAALLNIAGLQRTLSQRITKDVNVFALGGTGAAVAATQFGRDVRQFEQASRALRGRVEAPVIAMLDQADETFADLKTRIAAILDAVAEFFGAQRAAGAITGGSDNALKAVQGLVGQYRGLGARSGAERVAPFALGAAALLFLALLVYTLVHEARQRARASTEQNLQTQDAILTLLDQMGDLADGDLRINPEVTDQITGAIADSVNFAVQEMRGIVQRINDTSAQVARESDDATKLANQLADAGQRQAGQIAQAAEEVRGMATSLQEMSSSARQSADVAHGSVDVAKRGAEAVRSSMGAMDTMRTQIQETAKRIKRLGESSQQIGEIVGLIEEVSEQTNILSLNASIQAAMAGEAGRGFAVVADEVQRLAERSGEATHQIENLVKTIQADTNDAVASMEQVTKGVVEGARITDAAGQALSEIETVSDTLSNLIASMAQSAREQSERASGVSGRMGEIREISNTTSAGTRQTAAALSRLSNLLGELQASVAGFRLPA